MAPIEVAKIEMRENTYPFGVSSWEIKSMNDICTKFGAKFLEDNQRKLPLGSPRKVRVSHLNVSPSSLYSSEEPMPVRLLRDDMYTAQPILSVDTAFAHNIISWSGGPLLAGDVIPPPPGLEDVVLLSEEGRSSSAERSVDKAESDKSGQSDKYEGGIKCTKHGLHVCNRMFGGRQCKKADCLNKSSLCHEEECCSNRVRPRPSAREKQVAKFMARLAKAELENLELSEVATRLNEAERGLGYKLKALEMLQQCSEPWNLSADVRSCVIEELRKVISDGSSAFRVQELARQTLQNWDSDTVCVSCS